LTVAKPSSLNRDFPGGQLAAQEAAARSREKRHFVLPRCRGKEQL
jgi:hypothetical protein